MKDLWRCGHSLWGRRWSDPSAAYDVDMVIAVSWRIYFFILRRKTLFLFGKWLWTLLYTGLSCNGPNSAVCQLFPKGAWGLQPVYPFICARMVNVMWERLERSARLNADSQEWAFKAAQPKWKSCRFISEHMKALAVRRQKSAPSSPSTGPRGWQPALKFLSWRTTNYFFPVTSHSEKRDAQSFILLHYTKSTEHCWQGAGISILKEKWVLT